MNCRIVDLRNKEVINIKNGARLGYVSDVEVDTCDARLVAIVIYGREGDCIIDWGDIEVIGEDSILVNCNSHRQSAGCRRKLLENIICSL